MRFDEEASQTRDCRIAKNATLRAARPDSSRRKERWFGMTIKLDARLRHSLENLLDNVILCDRIPSYSPPIVSPSYVLRRTVSDGMPAPHHNRQSPRASI